MALSILRLGLQAGRLNCQSVRLVPACVMRERRAGITHKSIREPKDIKPFPYETKNYSPWHMFFDDTEKRFDENTRVIVVEGNLCTGKSTLAKKIAEEFDFVHFPEVNMDMLYIDDHGFDIRSLDDKLTENMRAFDEAKFYANPSHRLVPNFRYEMFAVRVEQYCDALAHVLNTGQGVVLERSPFSDFVFMDAIRRLEYINKEDRDVYSDMQVNCFGEMPRPHLVIYLDAPVDVIHKRIMDRKIPYEVNSKINWIEYLRGIEAAYKNNFLNTTKSESEMLIYNWADFGDLDAVIEDIERVDFETPLEDNHDSKFAGWKQLNPRHWSDLRHGVTIQKQLLINAVLMTPRFNVPQLIADTEELDQYLEVYDKYAPKYDQAFDPSKGWGYLFKYRNGKYRDQFRHAYRTR